MLADALSLSKTLTEPGAEFLDTDEEVLRGGVQLREAAGTGAWSPVWTLLNAGIPVDLQDHADGRTALMRSDDTEVTKLLLERGANVNLQDKGGKTALMLTEDVAVARLLLQDAWGAKVDLQDTAGETALMLTWHKDMAALLISRGAEGDTVELASMRGDRPMSQMAELEDVEMVASAGRGDIGSVRRFLLKQGVSVDLKDADGMTALMCTKDKEVAALLLERGADVDLKDSLVGPR